MSPLMAGGIGFIALLLLVLLGMPVAVAMGLLGLTGVAYIIDWGSALTLLKTVPYQIVANYQFSVVALFVLMGNLVFKSGVSADLYRTAHKWLGQMRGGLALATVGASAAFAAVSGASIAVAAGIGTAALPEMKRYNYSPALATGAIAAGGTMGVLIPPSVILVVYGIITEQSIGKLFLAGFIPGVLEAVFYFITIYILCKRNPLLGPAGARTSFKEKVVSLKSTWPVLALFLLVMGGIYAGIFSPSEAGAVGAFGALLAGLSMRRLSLQGFIWSVRDTAKTTAMIITIIMGAELFGRFLTVSRLPYELAEIVVGLGLGRYAIITLIIFFYVVLGCFMLPMPLIIITTPVVFPLILSLGFDPIWFGIVVVMMCEIGQITPPVGMNLFVMGGVAKDVPMGTIYRGVIPFVLADMCRVAVLVAFPQIVLFLPNLMK